MIDYEALKKAILESESLEALRKSGNMPPVPKCAADENYVFISYSHRDYKAVYCDLLKLHKKGVKYWYDYRLTAGKNWDVDVKNHLEDANCAGVIFYLSENFVISRSIFDEVSYVCGDGENPRKNYFAINLSEEKNSEDLITLTLGSKRKSDLKALGIDDKRLHEDVLIAAFPEKMTYISRFDDSGEAYVLEVLGQIKAKFNVTVDNLPIEDNEDVKELQEKLDFASTFAIKDGVLYKYLGIDEKVVIPDGVTVIGELAFEDCKFIKEVIIPESVNNIGKNAFNCCKNLISIEIPDSVTSIGDCVFSGCSSLTSISISDNITSIGDYAFASCSSLTSIIIPNDVESIGERAFAWCNELTSITIPDSVTSIGDDAFRACESLTSVTIPDSVTSIGRSAFYECSSLIDIYFKGTKEEWNAIEKGYNWDSCTPTYTVHCTDGDIVKD